MPNEIPVQQYETYLATQIALSGERDPAHELSHVHRVVRNAARLMKRESADPCVVTPAAWLHDCVAVQKSTSRRNEASGLAADAAVDFLRSAGYPTRFLDDIHHAIEAHSFSAAILPRTIEAKVVQDADRLDALGAIGVARCFAVGGTLGRPLYCEDDPFCTSRPPDDTRFTVDHFYEKLLTLASTMQTEAGREEAARRTDYMSGFLAQLTEEIG
jgi:uncharacterized protein